MSERMRRHDWTSSSLGSPRNWPQPLRSTVRLMLASKFPMFVAWGSELGFLYNNAYAELLGEKHPSALGQRFQDIWAEIWPDILPFIEAALRGEATWVENLPLTINRHGQDEETYFTFSYSPAFDDEERVVGMFCACTETTRQVLAERSLKAGVEDFRSMANDAPAMIWVTDPNGYCTYLNRRWYEFTGQVEEEALGLGWSKATHPDDQDRATAEFLTANSAQAPFSIDYRLRRADGVYRRAVDRAEPRFGPSGEFLGYIGLVFDIGDDR